MICFLDLPRLIIWMDFSNSMPGKPGKPALKGWLNLEHFSDMLAVDGKGTCDDLQTRSARTRNELEALNEKITKSRTYSRRDLTYRPTW